MGVPPEIMAKKESHMNDEKFKAAYRASRNGTEIGRAHV